MIFRVPMRRLLGGSPKEPLHWGLEALPAAALLIAILLPYIAMPLVWDSRYYLQCVEDIIQSPGVFSQYLCYDHPSFVFIMPFAMFQAAFPYSHVAVHLLVMACSIGSVFAFSAACGTLIPEVRPSTRAVCTVLYATQPIFVANAAGFNLDIGMASMSVVLLAFLLHRKEGWAAIVGILMAFTKEMGIVYYVAAVMAYLLTVAPFRLRSLRLDDAIRAAILVAPVGIFAFYAIMLHAAGLSFTENNSFSSAVSILAMFDPFDARFVMLIQEIFLFQFSWIQTMFIVVASCILMVRHRRKWSMNIVDNVVFLVLLLVVVVYCITRYVPYNNPRYILLALPLTSLLFAVLVVRIFKFEWARVIAVLVVITFQAVAIHASVDPVSHLIFGSFPFGERSMYPLGQWDSCCGRGRDQLAYNLEHFMIASLQDRIGQGVRPTSDTFFVTHERAWLGFGDGFDPRTFHRSMTEDAVRPHYRSSRDAVAEAPAELYFIDYPNFDSAEDLAMLDTAYDRSDERWYAESGYAIRVIHFMKKQNKPPVVGTTS